MNNSVSYTIEEIAHILRVSKLTVYDLIKKEELSAYRVGRQMRVDEKDLEAYKEKSKTGTTHIEKEDSFLPKSNQEVKLNYPGQTVISGQDIVLDILSKYIEKSSLLRPLRLYTGSLNSLISMYNGECDIVSVHLFDGDTGEYNIPYVKRVLISHPFTMINLVCRTAGLYVKPGNPLGIKNWNDLGNHALTLINREKGSGARVLLDEQLRLTDISPHSIKGYRDELTSHFSVASAVASGKADVGVGIENAAKMVNVDFIPLVKEQYDLVILKTKENEEILRIIKEATQSKEFRAQLEQLKGYDSSLTGKIIYDS